jgi:hypothetical protein
MDWPLYFSITLLAELGVRTFPWQRRIRVRDLLLANLATHPTLFFTITQLPAHPSVLYLGEGLVVAFEAILYTRCSRVPFFIALAFSALANLASYLAGLCV